MSAADLLHGPRAVPSLPGDPGWDLVADLGGTHLRLGLHDGSGLRRTSTVPWASSVALPAALRAFSGAPEGRRACLAVAAPVDGGDAVRLTNAAVAFSRHGLQEELGLERLLVVNDLAALARSTSALRPSEALALAGEHLDPRRTVVVVAPGTGLGAAALVPTAGAPVVVSGEAGHVPLPVTGASRDVVSAVLARHGTVTAEDLLSGTGLPLLDVVVRELEGERDPRPRSAAEVTGAGGRALEVFVDLLAAFTQTCVLALGARGGVVLGGGFLRGLVPALQEHGFAERVTASARMGRYLAGLPVVLDLRPAPALLGAALLLEDQA